jgi:hypothetical protein
MKGAHAQAIAYRPLPRDAGLDAPLTLLYRADRAEPALANFVALIGELSAGGAAEERGQGDRRTVAREPHR